MRSRCCLFRLVTLGVVVATASCEPRSESLSQLAGEVRLDPAGIHFNERLHGKLHPTEWLEDLATFLKPGARDRLDSIISTPVPPDSVNELSQLFRADCYWMPPGDVAMSWEVVARAQPDADLMSHRERDRENPTIPIEIGTCTLTDPRNRMAPVDDDGDEVELSWDSRLLPQTDARVVACTGPAPDSYNSCAPRRTCQDVPWPCANDARAPYCVIGCPHPVTQPTTLAVEVRADMTGIVLDDGTTLEDTGKGDVLLRKQFPTTYMPVAADTTVARPLVGSGRLTYQTAINDDDTWHENWSPLLVVSRVRVFSDDAFDGRTYVVPNLVAVNGLGCRPDSTGTLTWEGCPYLAFVTPTNQLRQLDRPVEWSVDLPATANPDRRYFIEFTVVNRARIAARAVLRFREASIDFGRYDYRATVVRTATIENLGPNSVVLTRLIADPRFSIRTSGRALAETETIPGHGSLELEVTRLARPLPTNEVERGLLRFDVVARVDINSVTTLVPGDPIEASFNGESYAGDPADSFPATVAIAPDRSVARFIVLAHFSNPIRIRSIAREGAARDAITVAATGACAQTDPQCKAVPLRPGELVVFEATRATSCGYPNAVVPIRIGIDECIDPTRTCADNDDWVAAPDDVVTVSIWPGAQCR